MQITTIWVWLSDHVYEAWKERESWWRNPFCYLWTLPRVCCVSYAWRGPGATVGTSSSTWPLRVIRYTLSGKTDHREANIYTVVEMSHMEYNWNDAPQKVNISQQQSKKIRCTLFSYWKSYMINGFWYQFHPNFLTPSNSQKPAGCSTIQLTSDTVYTWR